MALIFADRVKETTTVTGTGTANLGGAEPGFTSFVNGIGNSNTCHYCITDDLDWEIGLGTVTDDIPDTLSRDIVYASSNAGALVNWSAGGKFVFVTISVNAFNDKQDDFVSFNTQTGSAYTLVLSDETKYVRMDNAGANTLTIPLDSSIAFPLGTLIHIRQVGAGQTSIAPVVGSPQPIINTPETLLLNKQHSTATLIKVGIDEWDLVGDLQVA